MNLKKKSLLEDWSNDLRVICHGHYDAAVDVNKRHYKLGIPVVVLSAAVGTSVFTAIGKSPNIWLQVAVGLASLGVAILAALQTYLKYDERAEKHRQAGAVFGSLLKEIDLMRAVPPDDDAFLNWSNSFKKRWDEVSKVSPTIPKAIYKNYWARYKESHKPSSEADN